MSGNREVGYTSFWYIIKAVKMKGSNCMRKGYLVNYIYYIINEPERDLYIIENKITGEKRLMRLVNNRGSIRTLNILSKIKHPGLPVIDEIIEHEGDFYCIYEYPESESLENITIKSENSFTVEDACSFALEIAYAINLLHSQLEYPVLHLCILPSGIIVTDENKIRLRDYGLAFSQNNQEDTVTENFTDYEFLPPEIVNKEGCFIESDIYMIGMILKSMVYEKIKTSRIPDSIGRIITKSTMINPVDRYCNTGELIKELEEATDQFSKYNDISDISNPQSMLKDIVRGPCYTNTEYSGENINLIQPAQEVINSRIICVWNNS